MKHVPRITLLRACLSRSKFRKDEVPKDEFRSSLIILTPIKADQLRQQIRENRLKMGQAMLIT